MRRLKPIKSEGDYRSALREARRLFSARPGTADHDRLGVLGVLIDDYESRRFPIAAPDPVDAIKFTMDQKGYAPADLVRVLGSASRASEILRRRRRLTLAMVDALARDWGIPADILVRPYPLAKKAA
jgi:HTH-type transcriptional regulator/antitoxin HigA